MKENEQEKTIMKELSSKREPYTVFEVSKELDEQGVNKIQFKTIETPKEPIEYKRTHEFFDIKTFVDYILKYLTKNTVIYYDANGASVWCVLNEEDTKGYPEILRCFIGNKILSFFDEIESIQNSESFLTFIKNKREKVKDFLTYLHVMGAIKVSSKVERLDLKGSKSEYSFNIKNEVMGQLRGEPVEMPSTLLLEYEDFSMGLLNPIKLNILTNIYYKPTKDGALEIECIVSEKEKILVELKNQCQSLLNHLVLDKALVVVGRPKYDPVKR